ncbi:InlB B-repeat-containing protein [Listeria monocytogenes]|nr:LPXTG cell wall anchor domain-containing protein [Listeria monocytogenes]EIP2458355.1 InlB B-repeat-containing protein [Listeria monocytogenes]EIP2514712.1 InlB B-repeat-containing protein [Listeria monocytogenes]EIR6790360.1 InlB B-repeat-containing protein [Listeria monocytogenes]EIR6803605.1 InlB B-repeat-containing protein [Listeria monocytogenes]
MKQKKHVIKWIPNTLGFMLLISIGMWIGTSYGAEVQADTISKPTAINELFPDDALAEVIRVELGKTSVNEMVSQNELDVLTILDADAKGIKTIEGVQYVNNLAKLDLGANNLSDINALAGLTKLQELSLADNLQLSDIEALAGLKNLTKLYVTSLEISNISPLSDLTNLSYLWISSPKLSDIRALSNVTTLETLIVRDSPISDFSPIANLTNLTYLALESVGLKDSDLSYLNSITKLSELYLGSNELSDIRSLSRFNNLINLNLESNQIKDISPLSGLLNNLYYLSAGGQGITNIPIPFQTEISIPNSTIGIDGSLLAPLADYISDDGTYNSPNIIWNLPDYIPEVSYVYYQELPIGHGDAAIFQGTIYQPLQSISTAYKVVFNVEGKESSEMLEVDNLVKEPADPVKEGYTFTGWYDEKAGGNKWDFGTDKMPANDITLYAQFSINQYTATFDVDGKTTKQMVDYQALLVEPEKPTKEGYTFTGWYDAKTGGNKWGFATGKMPANNLTLYAHFTKQETPPNQDGGVSVMATNSGKSNPSTMNLPKTGDESTVLPIIFGFLCIGVTMFLGFRRRQVK